MHSLVHSSQYIYGWALAVCVPQGGRRAGVGEQVWPGLELT